MSEDIDARHDEGWRTRRAAYRASLARPFLGAAISRRACRRHQRGDFGGRNGPDEAREYEMSCLKKLEYHAKLDSRRNGRDHRRTR